MQTLRTPCCSHQSGPSMRRRRRERAGREPQLTPGAHEAPRMLPPGPAGASRRRVSVPHPNGCIPTAEIHCSQRAACGASVCQRTKSTRRYPPILPASPGGGRGSHGGRPQRTIAGRTPQTACAEGTAAGRKVKPSVQFVVNGSTACRCPAVSSEGFREYGYPHETGGTSGQSASSPQRPTPATGVGSGD
jgi:hypothetical protein